MACLYVPPDAELLSSVSGMIGTYGRVASFAGLAILTACSAPQPSASKAEENAAQQAFFNCIEANARSTDDGRSSVVAVGSLVASACKEQFGRSLAVSARGLSPAAQQGFFRDMQGKDAQLATSIVLTLRKRKS